MSAQAAPRFTGSETIWVWTAMLGFLSGPDINLYLGALASLNTSKVCPQAGQTKLFASRGAEWNSVRS
jgi:hypothetical protein